MVWLSLGGPPAEWGVDPLERIDQYRVYELASGLRPISALTMQSEPFAIAMTIVDAKRAIASCLKEDQCLFQSSKNAAQGLVQLMRV